MDLGAVEQVFAAGPVQVAGAKIIAAPFQFVTTGADNIRVISANSLVGVVLEISGLRLDEKSQIIPFKWTHIPNSDNTTRTEHFAFGKGALLSLNVTASEGTPMSGQTYVSVKLIRGLIGGITVVGTLLAGTVTASQSLGWPGSPIVASVEVEAPIRSVVVTNPAVGSEFSQVVPTGVRWELVAAVAQFTTSAVVAGRSVNLQVLIDGNALVDIVPQNLAQASSAWAYFWAAGITRAGDAVFFTQNMTLPTRLTLPAGAQIRSLTANRDAGDVFQGIVLFVRESLEVR